MDSRIYSEKTLASIKSHLEKNESKFITYPKFIFLCGKAIDGQYEKTNRGILQNYLQKQSEKGMAVYDFYPLTERISKDQQCPMTPGTVYYSLEILRELGILEYSRLGSCLTDLRIHAEKRVRLEDSEILKRIREKAGEAAWA